MWGPQFDQGGNPILGTNEFAGQQLDLTLDLPDMVNKQGERRSAQHQV
ncbi:MAG: hypothetical protein ACLSGF_10350 [Alistipes onderdonkii]